MIFCRFNSVARLTKQFRQQFARARRQLDTVKSPYSQILNAASKYDMSGCTMLLNQLEETTDKQNFPLYTKFLNNKMLVQFHFRQYGSAEMTILNTINYMTMFDSTPANTLPLRIRLVLLHMLYQTDKLNASKDTLLSVLPNVSGQSAKLVGYIEAMALLCQQKIEASELKLMELISADMNEYLSDSKQISLIALITIELLYNRDYPKDSESENQKVFEMIKNNQLPTIDLLRKINPNILLNYLNHYHVSNRNKALTEKGHVQSLYNKITLLLAQNSYIEGNEPEAISFMQAIKVDTLQRTFLEASSLFDHKQYKAVCKLLEQKVIDLGRKSFPEQDVLRMDVLKLLKLAYTKLDPERAQQIHFDIELHRFYNNVDPKITKIHHFNIPFRQYFSLDNFLI